MRETTVPYAGATSMLKCVSVRHYSVMIEPHPGRIEFFTCIVVPTQAVAAMKLRTGLVFLTILAVQASFCRHHDQWSDGHSVGPEIGEPGYRRSYRRIFWLAETKPAHTLIFINELWKNLFAKSSATHSQRNHAKTWKMYDNLRFHTLAPYSHSMVNRIEFAL